ncbi:hypothetical protein Hanom_Chr17g01570861 [Helianthus anomalus]
MHSPKSSQAHEPENDSSFHRLKQTRPIFFNGKERRANHRDNGRCGQGRLLDRRQPLGSPQMRGNPTSTCPKARQWNNR